MAEGNKGGRVLRFVVTGALLVSPLVGCGGEEGPTINEPVEETINEPPEETVNEPEPEPEPEPTVNPPPPPPELDGEEADQPPPSE